MGAVNLARRLLRDTRGATAVEYGLIVSLIVLAMVGVLHTLQTQTKSMWDNVDQSVDEAMEP